MAGTRLVDETCRMKDLLEAFKSEEIKQISLGNPPIVSLIIDFARYLKTPSNLITHLKYEIEQGKKNGYEVIQEIIVNWIASNKDDATLGTLLTIVEEKFKWEIVIGFLRNQIQNHARNFYELDELSRKQVLDAKFHFLGRQTNLMSFKELISPEFFGQMLNTIDNKFITGVLLETGWQHDEFQLPPEPSHYTNRSIEVKRKLSPEIFKTACEDIFIFEDTLPYDLSILVRPNPADVSGGQVDYLTVRFILLEDEEHLQDIVKISKSPVHRIRYEDNSYFWVRTFGSIKVVREFLTDEVEKITEDQFINETLSAFTSKPVSLCGGPGTGKSALLASLANKLFKTFPERQIMHVNFPNLIRQQTFSDKVNKSENNNLAEIFGTDSTVKTVTEILLDGLMNNENVRFEIFLDRFDETPLEQYGRVKRFLHLLLKNANIRIYLTYGPAIRQELENCLQIISFDISPFNAEEMESFLSTMVDSQICQMVLKSTDLLLKNEDIHKEAAGSPLQCSMLAEVYNNSTKKNFFGQRKMSWTQNPIKSLTELYREYLEIKFQQMGEGDSNFIKLIYYREAFNKLFPCNKNAKPILDALDKVVKTSTKSYEVKGDFQHKTFSEYLLAQFIVDSWKEPKTIENNTLAKFIYETLLATCESDEFDKYLVCSNDLETSTLESVLLKVDMNGADEALVQLIKLGWEQSLQNLHNSTIKGQRAFRHSSICYFLNEIISNDDLLASKSYMPVNLKFCRNSDEQFSQISKDFIAKALIAVSFSYKHLFRLVAEIFGESSKAKTIYVDFQTCQTILILAARQDDVETFKYFCKLVESNYGTSITCIRFHGDFFKNVIYEHTPLHEAAKRGNYGIFQHLLNVYKDKVHTMSCLAETCLLDSRRNLKYVINNKNKILMLLSAENIRYDFKSLESSLLDGVHIKLFTKVCDMTHYTLTEKDVKWLYKYVVYYFTNIDQMDVLVTWLISKDLARLLTHHYDDQSFLLIDALQQNVLGPETLEKIYNANHFKLGSIIYYVTKSRYRHSLLKKMIDLTGNVDVDNQTDPTILDWADSMLDVEKMKYAVYEKLNKANLCRNFYKQKVKDLNLLDKEIRKILREIKLITEKEYTGKILYDKDNILGRGSFSIVYSGTFNERLVAVKKIIYKAEHEKRIAQETKLLMECDGHENIIKCFCVHRSVHSILIALELCKFTLEDWMQKYLTTDTKVQLPQLLYQATKGVEYLHSKNVVHLDIAPQNILLIPIFDDDIRVKISDFGNSRKLGEKTDLQLKAGSGTIEWMAPEVFKMVSLPSHSIGQFLSTSADIFSLGCIFYYVLSRGMHPFGVNLGDITSNIQQDSPCVHSSLLKEPTFIHLFFLMTNQNPDIRPSASAILKHHIFWSEKTMLSFLVAVSNAADQPTVTSQISTIMDKIENYPLLKPYYEPSTSKGWIRFLCKDVQMYVSGIGCKRKRYEGDLFFDLVRAIRNMKLHYASLPKNVQIAVGAVPKCFMKYWLKRFAIVFEIIWLNLEVMKSDPTSALLEYYSDEFDFNIEKITDRADKILAKYIRNQCTEMVLRGTSF